MKAILVLLATTVVAQASPTDNTTLKLAAKMYLADKICPGVSTFDQAYHLIQIGILEEGISYDVALSVVAHEAVKVSDYIVEHHTTAEFCNNARLANW
ncbi:MAG: hypothetical protein EOR84_30615 [Mesorhizobium sp.]|uniref:hypothetical protein n=1 Tax=Mesorhizobium sp. TaxID=1871066 RepID=UPI000FE83AAF|nr:hypothetical protein [Mesorhizobium sp.]RWM86468.1 MAG: hypothetical protein EOR84_30615 [Mesorhizobium sp.]